MHDSIASLRTERDALAEKVASLEAAQNLGIGWVDRNYALEQQNLNLTVERDWLRALVERLTAVEGATE